MDVSRSLKLINDFSIETDRNYFDFDFLSLITLSVCIISLLIDISFSEERESIGAGNDNKAE